MEKAQITYKRKPEKSTHQVTMRILEFLYENPDKEFTRTQIEKNIGGEEWGRLNKFLSELYDLGHIQIINKVDSIGHIVVKITSSGIVTVKKYKDWKQCMYRIDLSNDLIDSNEPIIENSLI